MSRSHAVRAVYPDLVAAVEAWERSPTGEFEIPGPSERHRASCGCEVGPGVELTTDDLRAHRVHTGTAIFFWAVLMRKGGQDFDATNDVMEAFRHVDDVLDRHFPETSG